MMKSLKEQISDRCIHFNGVMNDCCEAGVSYASVREGKPYKFPCLKQGGKCSKVQFLSEDEVNNEIEEINSMSMKTLTAYAKIKEHFINTKENPGKLQCECGGELNYTVSESNGHIWARCKSCQISFNE